MASVCKALNEGCATDLGRILADKDGSTSQTLVITCHRRELLGCQLSRAPKATIAASALEHAQISRFATLGRVCKEILMRCDNGLFTQRQFIGLVTISWLKQQAITPNYPRQNGMVERVIRTRKAQCSHCHRFDGLQHPASAIVDWIGFREHPTASSGAGHDHTCRGTQIKIMN